MRGTEREKPREVLGGLGASLDGQKIDELNEELRLALAAVPHHLDQTGQAVEKAIVELQRHYDRAEEARNRAAIDIARAFKLPLLATNGVRHARAEQRQVLDLFTCIKNHCTLDQAGRLLSINCERHLKSTAQDLSTPSISRRKS
jgi:DNA polymerase III alpha subunit